MFTISYGPDGIALYLDTLPKIAQGGEVEVSLRDGLVTCRTHAAGTTWTGRRTRWLLRT